MEELEKLAREELAALVRTLQSGRAAAGTGPEPAGLPVFGERALRDFHQSTSPMKIFDLRTLRYVEVNDAALAFYGYSREEFLQLTVRDIRHPDEHRALVDTLGEQSEYLRHRPPRRERRKSGEEVVVESITQDVLFRGRSARLSLTIDITARLRMQEQLWRRQQEFEALAEHIPHLVARFDRGHRFVYVNSAVERLLGVGRERVLGRTQRELGVPEDVAAAFTSSLDEALSQGASHRLEFTMGPAGGERRFEAYHVPERDALGEFTTVLCIAHDVTERTRAEEQLRASEERFRQLAENIDEVFWISAPDLERHLYVSPAYEKIWGRSIESLRDDPSSWLEAVHPEDRPRLEAALVAVKQGGQFDVEYRIARPDGAVRWIRDRSYPMKGGDGTPLACGLAEDITAQKEAEAQRLADAVRQRDALVREVHHRIKNALQGVAGLLRQKARKHPATRPGIEEAISQLQSVALVYGLQETRSDGLLNLAEITDAICASAEGLIGGRVERTFERRSQRPACIAGSEAVWVAVALNELVFNALKHQRAGAGRKRARVAVKEEGDEAEIRITNRGRLPEGFDFAAGRAVGNGLGLVRTLLLAPGGSVRFGSAGNEVEVVLKLAPPLLASTASRRARALEKSGRGVVA